MLYQKKLLDKQKISNHNMAGGFDGMGVITWRTRTEHHTAQGMV